MKTLLTAFKGTNNTSFRLVSQLGDNVLLLTNSFSGLERDIDSIPEIPDVVYMFGVDKKLNREIRVESCAKCGDNTICTEFDVLTLSKRLHDHGIKHHISNTPTQYLCNWAYYHMLRKNRNTVFIHIPSIRGMDDAFMKQLVGFFSNFMQ